MKSQFTLTIHTTVSTQRPRHTFDSKVEALRAAAKYRDVYGVKVDVHENVTGSMPMFIKSFVPK